MLARLAASCYARRRAVLTAWIVVLVGVTALAKAAGGDLVKTFSLPGSESQRAFDVLRRDFARKGDTGDLVWRAKTGNWTARLVRMKDSRTASERGRWVLTLRQAKAITALADRKTSDFAKVPA